VISRSCRLIASVVVAGLATGCSTFSDNDLAARVGDAELSLDQLSRQLGEIDNTDSNTERADGALVRGEIDTFVRREVADQVGLFDQYADADGSLGVVCFYAVPVNDRAQADDVVARYESGEAWDDLIAEVAPGAGDQSRQPCTPTETIIPEVAAELAALDPDEPPTVLELTSPPGVFVVRAHTIDELDATELFAAVEVARPDLLDRIRAEVDEGGIYVDPRFGRFDSQLLSVVPLG
jgi:hypothetical protein